MLGPDEADALIVVPSAVKVAVPKPEETTENKFTQVVAEVMHRSIGAQEQMAQVMQTKRYQMARLIGTVSTNPVLPPLAPMAPIPRLAPRIIPATTSLGENSGLQSSRPTSFGSTVPGPSSLRPTIPRNAQSQ